MADEFKKCKTVGELKEAIKDLPDDMKVGTWDGDSGWFTDYVDGAPTTMYHRFGTLTPFGGYDKEDAYPTEMVLSL